MVEPTSYVTATSQIVRRVAVLRNLVHSRHRGVITINAIIINSIFFSLTFSELSLNPNDRLYIVYTSVHVILTTTL